MDKDGEKELPMSRRQDRHEQLAVFWCSLLGPLFSGLIPAEEAGPFLRELAETEYDFPDVTRHKPSRATLWRKWKQYREGGFEGLLRRRRKDRGRPRRATQAMIDKAIALNSAGELVLVRLTPAGYQELARQKIVGETWAHPAYAGPFVYARDDKQLVCWRLPVAQAGGKPNPAPLPADD